MDRWTMRSMLVVCAVVTAGCGDSPGGPAAANRMASSAFIDGQTCDPHMTEATDTCQTDLPGLSDAEKRVEVALPKDARLVFRSAEGFPTRSATYEMTGASDAVAQALLTAFGDAGLLYPTASAEISDGRLQLNTGPRYYVEVRFVSPAPEGTTRFELFTYIED